MVFFLHWIQGVPTTLPNPVLLVTHDLRGGTEHHVRARAQELFEQGLSPILLHPLRKKGRLRLSLPHRQQDKITWREKHLSLKGVIDRLRRLGCRQAEIHHWINYGADGLATIQQLLREGGLTYHVALHDYLAICPRITLTDEEGYYCGEPDITGCNNCLRRRGSRFGAPDIEQWRAAHGKFLTDAQSVRVPSQDMAVRLRRHFPTLSIDVVPHQDSPQPKAPPVLKPGDGRQMTILLLGNLNQHKGLPLILACARDARQRQLPIRFQLIGDARHQDREALNQAGVAVSGRYDNDEIYDLIAASGGDLVFLASLCPETYSYTLSIALAAGMKVAAFSFGAIAERLAGLRGHVLLPLDLMRDAGAVNDTLLKINRTTI